MSAYINENEMRRLISGHLLKDKKELIPKKQDFKVYLSESEMRNIISFNLLSEDTQDTRVPDIKSIEYFKPSNRDLNLFKKYISQAFNKQRYPRSQDSFIKLFNKKGQFGNFGNLEGRSFYDKLINFYNTSGGRDENHIRILMNLIRKSTKDHLKSVKEEKEEEEKRKEEEEKRKKEEAKNTSQDAREISKNLQNIFDLYKNNKRVKNFDDIKKIILSKLSGIIRKEFDVSYEINATEPVKIAIEFINSDLVKKNPSNLKKISEIVEVYYFNLKQVELTASGEQKDQSDDNEGDLNLIAPDHQKYELRHTFDNESKLIEYLVKKLNEKKGNKRIVEKITKASDEDKIDLAIDYILYHNAEKRFEKTDDPKLHIRPSDSAERKPVKLSRRASRSSAAAVKRTPSITGHGKDFIRTNKSSKDISVRGINFSFTLPSGNIENVETKILEYLSKNPYNERQTFKVINGERKAIRENIIANFEHLKRKDKSAIGYAIYSTIRYKTLKVLESYLYENGEIDLKIQTKDSNARSKLSQPGGRVRVSRDYSNYITQESRKQFENLPEPQQQAKLAQRSESDKSQWLESIPRENFKLNPLFDTASNDPLRYAIFVNALKKGKKIIDTAGDTEKDKTDLDDLFGTYSNFYVTHHDIDEALGLMSRLVKSGNASGQSYKLKQDSTVQRIVEVQIKGTTDILSIVVTATERQPTWWEKKAFSKVHSKKHDGKDIMYITDIDLWRNTDGSGNRRGKKDENNKRLGGQSVTILGNIFSAGGLPLPKNLKNAVSNLSNKPVKWEKSTNLWDYE